MGPGWDQTHDPWICKQTRYWLRCEAWSILICSLINIEFTLKIVVSNDNFTRNVWFWNLLPKIISVNDNLMENVFPEWKKIPDSFLKSIGDLQINKNLVCKIVNFFLPINLNICFGCSKEPSHWDGSFEYQQHMLWLRNKKIHYWLHILIWMGYLSLLNKEANLCLINTWILWLKRNLRTNNITADEKNLWIIFFHKH